MWLSMCKTIQCMLCTFSYASFFMNVLRAICHLTDIFMIFSGLHQFKRVSETSATTIKRIRTIWSHGPATSLRQLYSTCKRMRAFIEIAYL